MRQFGIIQSSIWRSKRFRELSSDLARLTYIYLHTTKHGNSIGTFEMPPELAALDMRRDADEVREGLAELARVKLIRHDPEEELVQIVNFFRFNSPSSRKQLAGPLKIVRDALPSSPVRDACACDLVVAMYQRAQTWGADVEARAAFLHEAAQLVHDLELKSLLASQEIGLSEALLIALSEALLIDLAIEGDRNTDTNSNADTDADAYSDAHTYADREGVNSAKSRPARKTPDDLQAKIKSLGHQK